MKEKVIMNVVWCKIGRRKRRGIVKYFHVTCIRIPKESYLDFCYHAFGIHVWLGILEGSFILSYLIFLMEPFVLIFLYRSLREMYILGELVYIMRVQGKDKLCAEVCFG